MGEMAEEAVSLATDCYQIKLDYSDDSIADIENILSQLHDEYTKTGNEEGLYGLAIMCGAYIGEVAQRNHQVGRWEKDHPTIGEMTFPFYLEDDSCIFPVGWCQKRILDGADDNVVPKYRICVIEQMKEISNQEVEPTVKTPVE